jgi:hypothetical protein
MHVVRNCQGYPAYIVDQISKLEEANHEPAISALTFVSTAKKIPHNLEHGLGIYIPLRFSRNPGVAS